MFAKSFLGELLETLVRARPSVVEETEVEEAFKSLQKSYMSSYRKGNRLPAEIFLLGENPGQNVVLFPVVLRNVFGAEGDKELQRVRKLIQEPLGIDVRHYVFIADTAPLNEEYSKNNVISTLTEDVTLGARDSERVVFMLASREENVVHSYRYVTNGEDIVIAPDPDEKRFTPQQSLFAST